MLIYDGFQARIASLGVHIHQSILNMLLYSAKWIFLKGVKVHDTLELAQLFRTRTYSAVICIRETSFLQQLAPAVLLCQ